MRPLVLPKMFLAAALAAGCTGTLGYTATVPIGVEVAGPDLVYAAPGVQVIADYDEPIFFADNVYWRFDGVTWYRSTSYTGGWVYAPPPPAIARIDRPYGYRHYRPQGWEPRHGHVRDHRVPDARAMRRPPPPPPPAPDHRGDHGDRGDHGHRDHRDHGR